LSLAQVFFLQNCLGTLTHFVSGLDFITSTSSILHLMAGTRTQPSSLGSPRSPKSALKPFSSGHFSTSWTRHLSTQKVGKITTYFPNRVARDGI
jgi:hypothetical protein